MTSRYQTLALIAVILIVAMAIAFSSAVTGDPSVDRRPVANAGNAVEEPPLVDERAMTEPLSGAPRADAAATPGEKDDPDELRRQASGDANADPHQPETGPEQNGL
ncbi:hypothetical protein [Hyphococcus sp.]|jgi:hypothetical protein|uniref:hypothetical protein n=1 Tax=Hyphococcus sp. TaxID=2038636 RepID=UPI003D0E82CA